MTDNKKSFKDLHKLKLLYYVLSFIVLFLPIYTQHIPGREQTTSLYGFTTMAKEMGWLYYIATAVGLMTVFVPFLEKTQDFAAKAISVINLFVVLVVYIPLVKDTIGGNMTTIIGSTNLNIGFWATILLQIIAVIGFWFAFIMRLSNKRKAKETEKQLKEEEERLAKEAAQKEKEAAEAAVQKQIEENAIDVEFSEKEVEE